MRAMKKQILSLLIAAACIPLGCGLAQAQTPQNSNERILIEKKDGSKRGFWVDNVEEMKPASINFAISTTGGKQLVIPTDEIKAIDIVRTPVEATGTVTVEPQPDKIGRAEATCSVSGNRLKNGKFFVVEEFILRGAKPANAAVMTLLDRIDVTPPTTITVHTISGPNNFSLDGLQRTYKYLGVVVPIDQDDCYGEPVIYPFTMPDYALVGNYEGAIKFEDITYKSVKVTATPPDGDDNLGYFFLLESNTDEERERMMQMLGIPDLKHYTIAYGSNKGKPYTEEQSYNIKDLRPGRTYIVYAVWIDKNGQYSDVKKYPITTAKKGTDQEAKTAITLSDITKNAVTFTATPDENTSVYRNMIVEKGAMTDKELESYFEDQPESINFPILVEEDTFRWETLTPNTAYYAVTRSKNGEGVWGPLVKKEFSTLAE